MAYKNIAEGRSKRAAWNRRHQESVMTSVRAYQARTIAKVIAAYGGKCVSCGTPEKLVLHHRNCDGREHRQELAQRGDGCFRVYLWAIKNQFPKDKLELQCKSCHARAHARARWQGRKKSWTITT